MKKKSIFSRVIKLVAGSIMLFSFLMGPIYTFATYDNYARMTAEAVLPKVQTIARLIEAKELELIDEELIKIFISEEYLGNQGRILILDEYKKVSYITPVTDSDSRSELVILEKYALEIEKAYRGEESIYVDRFFKIKEHTVSHIASVPIFDGEQVVGVVCIVTPLEEFMLLFNSFRMTMLIAFILSIPMIFIIGWLFTKRFVRPLNQMRDVAVSMAKGNFEVRASINENNEIGELGESLNYLSSELSGTISALELEKNRLMKTLNGISEGIIAVDIRGDITHVNPAIYHYYGTCGNSYDGIEKRESIIKNLAVWKGFEDALSNNEAVTLFDHVDEDTTLRIVITPLIEEVHVVGAVGFFYDISESERLEKVRRDYVANVSHELRTPLTSIRGLIEPLRDELVSDEETKMRYYDIILSQTLRLSLLINDLLELSGLQSGKVFIKLSQCNIQKLGNQLLEEYLPLMHEKRIELTVNIEKEIMALCNEARTYQVLVILIDNALKFSPEEGHISVSALEQENEVMITIKDDGIGIIPQDIPHLFERFYKADKVRNTEGTGLGLAIAKEIVERMGGKVGVHSQVGVGSEFYFTLKVR